MFRRSPERGRPRAGAQGYALPDETAEDVGARPWGRWAALAAAFAVVALTAPFLAARGPSAAGAPRPPTPSGCAEGPRPEGRFYVGRPTSPSLPPLRGRSAPLPWIFAQTRGRPGAWTSTRCFSGEAFPFSRRRGRRLFGHTLHPRSRELHRDPRRGGGATEGRKALGPARGAPLADLRPPAGAPGGPRPDGPFGAPLRARLPSVHRPAHFRPDTGFDRGRRPAPGAAPPS
jgi:hypothetical protein